jgi:hypothetical protein
VLPRSVASTIAAYADAQLELNPSQIKAVEDAAERGLTVIWGPPGTGKTKTLAGYVLGLTHHAVANNEPLKILISAQTYKAVEELIDRVIDALGNDPSSPADVFIAYSKSRPIRQASSPAPHVQVTAMHVDDNGPHWKACAASLSNPNRVTIIATSVQQAHNFASFTSGNILAPVFDVVIMDECSQIPVTKALAPLATLKEDCRLVVAGDHLQMPPILALDAPVNAEYLVGSVQNYLLKRQFSLPVHSSNLDTNYRSAEHIVAYARTIGYPQTLQAFFPNLALHLLAPVPTPSTNYPATLPWSTAWADILDPAKVTMTLLHDDDLSSQNNSFEAKMVAGLIWCLWETTSCDLDGRTKSNHQKPTPKLFWEDIIGVVTPHRAQRALIIRELKALFPAALHPYELIEEAVDTVEKFQGGERHMIMVSFGVADADVIAGEEAFLMQLERINVAISRAQAKCVVVMPTNLASHVPQDKKALETAHALKGYVEEYCSKEQGIQIALNGMSRNGKLRWTS